MILVGLKPGSQKVWFELADPTHKVVTSETAKFTVPDPKTPKSPNEYRIAADLTDFLVSLETEHAHPCLPLGVVI